MEIVKIAVGRAEESDICFAESVFVQEDQENFVFAIETDELILLVRSDVPFLKLHQNIQENSEDDCNTCDYAVDSWDAKGKTTSKETVELDLEQVLAYCMESDLETYQCWRHDGNEGLYEASESDGGLAFVLAHDLLTSDDFPNVREMVEDDDDGAELISLLEEIEF